MSKYLPFEGTGSGGQVIVLYIHNFHTTFYRPFDGSIQSVNDVPVVLGDIILYIDDNKGFMVHVIFLPKRRLMFDPEAPVPS